MSLKVIRVSRTTYTMLERLSQAVLGLPVARVVEELARVEPVVFRRAIMKRLEALPASDAGDGSRGGDVGSTSQPRAGSAADPDDGSTGGNIGSTSRPRAGSTTDPEGGSTGNDVESKFQSRAGSVADAGDGSTGGDAGSTSRPAAGSAAPPKPKLPGEKS